MELLAGMRGPLGSMRSTGGYGLTREGVRRNKRGPGKQSGKSHAVFGEEEVMGVDKSSDRFLGLVRSQRKLAKVIRDVLTLVLATSHKMLVEEGSGLRVRGEFPVHLWVLRKLGLWEGGSTRRSALRHMGINLVSVTRCCRSGVVGEGMEVDNGITGDRSRC